MLISLYKLSDFLSTKSCPNCFHSPILSNGFSHFNCDNCGRHAYENYYWYSCAACGEERDDPKKGYVTCSKCRAPGSPPPGMILGARRNNTGSVAIEACDREVIYTASQAQLFDARGRESVMADGSFRASKITALTEERMAALLLAERASYLTRVREMPMCKVHGVNLYLEQVGSSLVALCPKRGEK